MFGYKALKEEVLHYKNKAERIENEKWDVYRENGQLEREKTTLNNTIYAQNSELLILRKEKKKLEEDLKRIDADRLNITKDYMILQNKKLTKEELIEQLAELLLNENRGAEKEHLIAQMNVALRINNEQPMSTPEGDGSQWIPQP